MASRGDSRSPGASLARKPTILNNPPIQPASNVLLHELFTDNSPARIALSFLSSLDEPPENFTYHDLGRLSDQLAHRLVSAKLHKRVIPVVMSQSPALYIALLAVLKSGNVYCPVLPDTSAERLQFICKDVDAPLVLIDSETTWTMSYPSSLQVSLTIDRNFAGLSAVPILPSDLAYTMYTSGSTGTPKAVMITHCSASTSILAHNNLFLEAVSEDTFLQFANSTFDISIFEIFSAWVNGMKLIGATRHLLLTRLPDIIAQTRVSYLELTPSMASLIPDQHHPLMSSVKKLITIGEMLTKRVILAWAGKLINAYGPTEATLHSSFNVVDSVQTDPRNIGRPLPTCSLMIMNPDSSELLPERSMGELCIAGPQVSLGYLGRDDLTHNAFVHIAGVPGFVYRTGDLAQIVNGEVIFLGRKQGDTQVKLNGQRIELGEIEHAIEKCESISSVAVIKYGDSLFAFVVPVAEGEVDLKLDTIACLPLNVRPIFIILNELPTSTAGKRDYRRLASLAEDHLEGMRAASLLSKKEANLDITEHERQIMDSLQHILPDIVQVTERFDSFGLDSLGAIKVVMKLREAGWSSTVFDVLDSGSVRELAKRLGDENVTVRPKMRSQLRESHISQLHAKYADATHFAPCSAIQTSMLAATLSDTTVSLYYNHVVLSVDKNASIELIRNAWQRLISDNEILRTAFHAETGSSEYDFLQIVYGPSSVALDCIEIDQTDLTANYVEHKKAACLCSDNLSTPPVNARIYSTPASTTISLMIHHALYDAWSLDLMIKQLDELMASGSQRAHTSYTAVVNDILWLSRPDKAKTQYWEEYLHDVNMSEFPCLSQEFSTEVKKSRVTLDAGISLSDFDRACNDLRTSPQALGQVAWALVVSWLSNESRIALAITTSGRTLPIDGIEEIPGPFITTFPFVCDMDKEMSVSTALSRTSQFNIRLNKYNMSYRDILKCSNTNINPDSLFVYQKTGTENNTPRMFDVESEEDHLEFSVVMSMNRQDDRLVFQLDADESVIPMGAARIILAQIDTMIRSMLHNPSQKLVDLRKLDGKCTLASSADCETVPCIEGRLDDLVQMRARSDAYKDSPALQFYDSLESSVTLSYSQLDSIANRLARSLADEVLGPKEIIAICLNKSIEMYASILAILKLGCSYVALEPSLPDERILTILEVTRARFVYTDAQNISRFTTIKGLLAEELASHSAGCTFESRPSQGLAYVLMTSGTTGIPKACLVSHVNVLHNCDALNKLYPHHENDRMLQFTSYTFDVSVFEIFFTWLNGMCLVSMPKDLMLSHLSKIIRDFRISHLNMTASAATLLKSSEVPDLKCFITSGESSSRAIIQDWAQTGKYFNAYGPTETTNVCSARFVDSSNVRPASIGKMLESSSAFVLDGQQNLLPRLAQGELYVGGSQVIEGYLDEEKTMQSFIDHAELGRIYRTGDVVRMLEDKSLLIIGRADSQVKIRGHRVELEEINHVLRSDRRVRDAATIFSDQRLLAFVHLDQTCDPVGMVDSLLHLISNHLPHYMLPNDIHPVFEPLPLTTTYKLDIRKLITSYEASSTLRQSSQLTNVERSEWTQLSKQVAEIICRIADIPFLHIKPDTSIFGLGLDSISAIKISSAISKQGLGNINVSSIMRHSSAESIANLLRLDRDIPPRHVTSSFEGGHRFFRSIEEQIRPIMDHVLSGIGLVQEDIESLLPCTSIQEGILLETSKRPEVNYINHSIMTLRSSIDSVQLRRACLTLAKRTACMRTCFAFTTLRDMPCLQAVLKHHEPDYTTEEVPDMTSAIEAWKIQVQSSMALDRPPVRFLELKNDKDHWLVLSLHHSLFDGWSLSLILQDLENIYFENDLEARPGPTRFVGAVREGMARTVDQAEYWSSHLADFEPSSFPVLSISSKSEQVIRTHDMSATLENYQAAARRGSHSLLSILQTGWTILLSQIVGSNDVCFGTAVSGRTLAIDGIEDVIMPLFNVFPVRSRLDQSSTLDALSSHLHKSNLELSKNPHCSLGQVKSYAKLSIGQDLFDTIFILQSSQHCPSENGLFQHVTDDGDSNYRLMIEFIPQPFRNNLQIRVTARNNIVSGDNLDSMVERLNHILGNVLDASQMTIRTSQMTTKDSLRSITAPPIPADPTELLHDAFFTNSEAVPSRIALEYMDENREVRQLTYQTLASRAQSLAARLRGSCHYRRNSPVVMMMTSVPDIYIAFLGMLCAGMVYTPISIDTPPDRLRYILNELQPSMILVDSLAVQELALSSFENSPRVLLWRNLMALPAPRQSKALRSNVDDLAYIIYTSGSTGRPKAVMLQHKAAVSAVRSSRSLLPLASQARWLQFASLTFDMSIYDITVALSCGITLCAAPRDQLLNNLTGVIQTLKITHLDLTPSVARTLRRMDLPSVELLFCIGEQLSQTTIAEWGSLCLNVYGPTEAAMACTAHSVKLDSLAQNIGHSFQHAQIAIFDTATNCLLPLSCVGELCIGGPQLSKGYLNDVEKSHAAFFYYEDQRFYRTGDLSRMLTDRSLAFVGRRDNQTKLRGQRIELDEISSVLFAVRPDVASVCSMIMHSTESGSDQLVSFVATARDEGPVKELVVISDRLGEELSTAISRQLPVYMVPNHILQLSYVPLNAAQKIDRRRLTELWRTYQEAQIKDVAPKFIEAEADHYTPSETILRQVLSDISGTQLGQISRNTSIYQLGLDSVSAMQIVAYLKTQGITISVMDILQRPTISKLASVLAEQSSKRQSGKSDSTDDESLAYDTILQRISARTTSNPRMLLCTPVQENMVAQFIQSKGQAYYNYLLLEVSTEVDLTRLRLCWHRVVSDLAILRAGFLAINTKDCQYALVLHDASAWLRIWDETTMQDAHKESGSYVARIAQELLKDTSQPSLRLCQIAARGRNYILWSAHHALYDGHSLQAIFSMVKRLYQDERFTIADTIEDDSRKLWSIYRDKARQKQSQEYWATQLQQTSLSPFPNLNNRTEKSSKSIVERHRISRKLQDIERDCQALCCSLSNLALTAWLKIVSAYAGEARVATGLVLSGRIGTDLLHAVHPCMTTVPLCCSLEGSVVDTIKRVEELTAAALPHQHLPLHKLKRPDATNLFDTLFVFQKTAQAQTTNESLWTIAQDVASVEIPLSIEILPNADDNILDIVLTFESGKLPKAHAIMILRQYEELLLKMLIHPDEQILDLEIHLKSDVLSVLKPQAPLLNSPVRLVHDFVRHYSERTPEAVAFEFANSLEAGSQVWTYLELEEQSNKLANYLMSTHQLTGSAPIAICFEKCPEAFITILAVLKTGSPFCCLDATAPIDRKKYIIGDCGASAVLCNESFKMELQEAVRVKVISIGSLNELTCSTALMNTKTDESSLCYILYTSGSTGTPKGCLLSHKSVVQGLTSFQTQFCGRFGADTRFLAFAALHFDVSVLETYFSWSVGGRVCAAPKDALLSDIPGAIAKFSITHIDLTPQLAMTLLPEEARTLQVFITGGEMLRSETVEHWGDSGILFNFYGPTEATIGCTALRQVRKGARPSNIGQQWTNCGSIVQSSLGTKAPALRGALGNLLISGAQVGEGYMNLKEATEKRFRYNEILSSKTYDTGDLVRLLEVDLSFEFVGRADSQIKLRGQRIETGEIDSVIFNASEDVTEAVTLVLKHASQPKDHLVSFVVMRDAVDKTRPMNLSRTNFRAGKLFDACHGQLATYMIPSYIVPLTSIHLTPTNKVDQKQIRAVYDNIDKNELQQYNPKHHRDSTLVVDQTILMKLKQTLQEMTGVESIDDESSVFELGLDSVSVIGLVRNLRANGLEHCTVSLVMTSESVRDLAANLSSSTKWSREKILNTAAILHTFKENNMTAVLEQLCLSHDDVEEVLPCTPLVEGLLVETMQHAHMKHLNQFGISGSDISRTRLRQAYHKLVEQTPILRSRFIIVPDGLAQVIVKPGKDKAGKDGGSSYPLNTALVRLNESEGRNSDVYHLEIHHALYDGISLEFILHDLNLLYADLATLIMRPSIVSTVAEILNLDITSAKDFWSSALSRAKILVAVRNTSATSSSKQTIDLEFDKIEQFAKLHHCTPNVIFQAAWALLMHKVLSDDSIYGTIVSGRTLANADAEHVVYPTFNTLPMYVSTAKASAVGEIIREIQSFYGGATAYQHTPLREVKKCLGVSSDAALMDTVIVYQKQGVDEHPDLPHALDFSDNADDFTGFAIALDVTADHQDRLHLTLKCEDIGVESADLLSCFIDILYSLLDNKPLEVIQTLLTNVKSANTTSTRLRPSSGSSNTEKSDHSALLNQTVVRDILSVVAELIGSTADKVSPVESFFTLGLDSIDVVKLSARLKSKYDHHFSVNDILQNSSVDALWGLYNSKTRKSSKSYDPLIPSNFTRVVQQSLRLDVPIEYALPASPMQAGILTASLGSAEGMYLNHTLLKLADNVSLKGLTQAWQSFLAVTPMLRTSFEAATGVELPLECAFVQIVHPTAQFDIERMELPDSMLMHQFRLHQESMIQLSSNKGVIPFFLKFFITEAANYLSISIHHALYDGASLDMIFRDIQRKVQHREIIEHRPPYSLLIEHILHIPLAAADIFWTNYLRGCSPKLLAGSSVATTHKIEMTSAVNLSQAQNICRSLGITLQSMIQCCYAIFLMEVYRKPDVLYGTISSGRSFATEAGSIIGPCMNTIPIRAVVNAKSSFKALSQDLHRANVELVEHLHTPLRRIQKLVAKGPLFEALFVFQNSTEETEELEIWTPVSEDSAVEFPLAVECNVTSNNLKWTIAMHEGFLHNTNMVSTRLEEILVAFITNPSKHIAAVTNTDLLRSSQRATLDTSDEAPLVGTLEIQIAEIVCEITGLSSADLTRRRSIFSFGMDSISVIQLSKQLRARNLRISVGDILRNPCIADIHKVIKSSEQLPAGKDIICEDAIAPTPSQFSRIFEEAEIAGDLVEAITEATPSQLYFLASWKRLGGTRFMSNFCFKLTEGTTVQTIQDRWQNLCSDHPILRTAFLFDRNNHSILQCTYKLVAQDRTTFVCKTALDSEAAIEEFLHSNAFTTPSLSRPPVSLTAIKSQSSETLVMLSIHHAMYDATIIAALIETLRTGERDRSELDYFDFARRISKENHGSYWQNYLLGTKPFYFAHQNDSRMTESTIIKPSNGAGSSYLDFFSKGPPHGVAVVDSVSGEYGVTTQSLLLAAIGQSIARLAKQDDIILGMYLSGRSLDMEGIDSVFGPTVNIVPIRFDKVNTRNLQNMAETTHQTLIEMNSLVQQTPIHVIHESTGWRDVVGGLIDVAVNILPRRKRPATDPLLNNSEGGLVDYGRLKECHIDLIRTRYANSNGPSDLAEFRGYNAVNPTLDIEVEIVDDAINFGVFCSTSVLSKEQAQDLVDDMRHTLQGPS